MVEAKKRIVFWLWVASIIIYTDAVAGEDNVDSAPEDLILSFCNSPEGEDLNKFYYKSLGISKKKKDITGWSDCEIISSGVTKISVGERLYSSKLSVSQDDVEVVLQVRVEDSAYDNPLTKYWYLLRHFDKGWKIISYHHMPDSNYPDIP